MINNRFLTPGITKEQGVNIWRLPLYFELHTTNGYVCLKGLKNALKTIQPDIIHCHGIISLISFAAARLKRCMQYGLVFDNHTSFVNLYNYGEGKSKKLFKKFVYKAFSTLVNFIVLPKADSVVAIGEQEELFLRWLFSGNPIRFPIIHLGADHRKFFRNDESRSNYRKKYNWGPQDLILGHAGKIQPSKGIENLIKALPLLNDYLKIRDQTFLIGSIDIDWIKKEFGEVNIKL